MGFKRTITPRAAVSGPDLPARLAGLGMALGVDPDPHANIEDAVMEAVQAGMEGDDVRLLGLVTAWLDHYHHWVHADRIVRCLRQGSSTRVQAYWHARAQGWSKDLRWRRLRSEPMERMDLLVVGTPFLLARHGEDSRFAGTVLRVPHGTLRIRPGDIEPSQEIARRHGAFRWRLLVGPGYRADCLAALEVNPEVTPAALARQTYASFATAWGTLRDVQMMGGLPKHR